jgi:hypothetical protein
MLMQGREGKSHLASFVPLSTQQACRTVSKDHYFKWWGWCAGEENDCGAALCGSYNVERLSRPYKNIKIFLSAFKSCVCGRYIATFSYVLTLYFNLIHPIILPHSPPPFIEQFQCSLFMHEYKIHPPYSPTFTLSLYPPPSTGNHSWIGPILPSCPSFFKCIMIVQGSLLWHFRLVYIIL